MSLELNITKDHCFYLDNRKNGQTHWIFIPQCSLFRFWECLGVLQAVILAGGKNLIKKMKDNFALASTVPFRWLLSKTGHVYHWGSTKSLPENFFSFFLLPCNNIVTNWISLLMKKEKFMSPIDRVFSYQVNKMNPNNGLLIIGRWHISFGFFLKSEAIYLLLTLYWSA